MTVTGAQYNYYINPNTRQLTSNIENTKTDADYDADVISAVQNILKRIENPLGEVSEEYRANEKKFYENFLENLKELKDTRKELKQNLENKTADTYMQSKTIGISFVKDDSEETSIRDVRIDQIKESAGSLANHVSGKDKAPYSFLATDGVIEYNGVQFTCNYENNTLCLGDTSNPKDCLTIPLSGGGSLVVNRDNIGDLAKAISMFSPEDIKRIMTAITKDNMCKGKLKEIEDAINSIGEADKTNSSEENAKAGTTSSVTDNSKTQNTSSVSDTAMDTLLAENTKSVENDTEENGEKVWYITCYTEDGIWCKKLGKIGEQSEDLWRINLDDKSQYQKVLDFIHSFDQNTNFSFANSKSFWTDYLDDKINEGEFRNFFEELNNGDINGYTDINSEMYKKYAQYFESA